MHKYTQEEKEFMINFVPGHSYSEIQQEFISKFGWAITKSQIKSYIGYNKLKTGRNGRFKKGVIPHNKGKKMPEKVYEKAKATMFQKGNKPYNYKPIGSERVTKDGYIEVKVKDTGRWVLKHRYVWENEKGEIPQGYIIIFKDGDRKNVDINNLLMVKKDINVLINSCGLNRYMGELKETAVNIAKLKKSITNSKKKIRNENR